MLARLRVAQRLSLLVVTFVAGILIVGGMQYAMGQATLARFASTYHDRVVPLAQLKAVSDMYAVNIVDTAHKLRDGTLGWEAGARNIAEARLKIEQNWKAYVSTYLTPEETTLVREAERSFTAANAAVERLTSLIKKQDLEGLHHFTARELYPAIDPLSDPVSRLVDLQLRVADEEFNTATRLQSTQNLVAILTIATTVMLGSGLSYYIIRRLAGSLGGEPEEAAGIAARIAAGDLNGSIHVRVGDTQSVLASMNIMQIALRDVVRGIAQNSAELTDSAAGLASAAAQVAGGSETQSTAAAGIATAVEQMAVSIDTIANHSTDAALSAERSRETMGAAIDSVRSAANEVSRIAQTVNQSSATIARLSEQSRQIASVVSVIREVADQTNLLALNAAIEAARAGEQGRGFAVVADEVRKLAERTSVSTGEINHVVVAIQEAGTQASHHIEEATGLADSGAARAHEAGEAIASIGQIAEQMSSLVHEISNALSEQKQASHDIAAKVESVSQMTEENSAAASTVMDAAHRLSQQADTLRKTIAHFRC